MRQPKRVSVSIAAGALASAALALAPLHRTVAAVSPATSYNGAYTVSWTDASGTSGVTAYLAQSLNGGAWTRTAVSGTYSKAFTGMAAGTYAYKLQVYEYDLETRKTIFSYERNLGSVLVTTLTAPSAPGAITGPTTSTTGSYAISWGAATPAVTRYVLYENGVQQYDGPNLSSSLSGRKDGAYKYAARACNAMGCGPLTSEFLVTVDVTLTTVVPDHPVVAPAVPAQGVVGAIPGRASTDGGAAVYRIDVEVPPGRAGMEPDVALAYGSRSGNGVAGVGWALSAGSTIYRCPRTLELEGGNRPVQLDANDRLCIEGRRMVLVEGTFGLSGSRYLTETDPFDRITLSGDIGSRASSFLVEHKSGKSSRYEVPTSGGGVPATWYLTSEWDRQKNCIGYGYSVFSNPGGGADQELVLSIIYYTGTEGAGAVSCAVDTNGRKVTFSYTADREDRRTTYAAGQATVLTARLAGITTWVGQTAVLQYLLGYRTSNATRRSLLASVTKCAGAGCAAGQLPATTFAYREDAPFSGSSFTHLADPRDGVTPLGPDWAAHAGSDFDGDGTRDHVYSRWPRVGAPALDLLALSSQSAGQGVVELTPAWTVNKGYWLPPIHAAGDWDQDGLADAPTVTDGALTFTSFAGGAPATTITATFTTGEVFQLEPGANVHPTDYDGDGLVDVVVATGVYDAGSKVGAVALVMYPRVDAGRGQAVFDKARAVVLPQPVTWVYSPMSARWIKWVPAVGYLVGNVKGSFQSAQDPPAESQTLALDTDLSGDGKDDQYLERVPGNSSAESGVRSYLGDDRFSVTRSLSSLTTTLTPGGVVQGGSGPFWWLDVNGDGLVDRLNLDGRLVWLNRGGVGGNTAFTQASISAVVDTDRTTPVTIDMDHQNSAFVMDVDADGADEVLVPATPAPGWSYCYLLPLSGGEYDMRCAGDPTVPELPLQVDRSIYTWDAYKIRDRGDGTYWLVRVPTGLSAPPNLSRATGDFDGDGLPDVAFRLSRETQQLAGGVTRVNGYYEYYPTDADMGPYLVTNGAHAPDLLVTAVDGLGAEARWHYRPLSHKLAEGAPGPSCDPGQPFYAAHNAEANRGEGYVFFTSSMWAVSEFDVSHGAPGSAFALAPTCYRYEDAMLHLKGRSFQGFKKIVAEERLPAAAGEPAPAANGLSANNRRTTTTFSQEPPFTNKVKRVTVELVAGGTLGSTDYWWHAQLVGASAKLGPWIVYPTATQERSYDLPAAGGALLATRTSVNEIDVASGESRKSCTQLDDLATSARLAAWPALPASVKAGEVTSSTYSEESRTLVNDTATWWLGRVSSVQTLADFRTASVGDPTQRPPTTSSTVSGAPPPLQCPTVTPTAWAKRRTTNYVWNGDTAALGSRRKVNSEEIRAGTTWETTGYSSYDAYGNLTSRVVHARDVLDGAGSPIPHTTVYGPSADGYFIETAQNPAGHVATSVHDSRWGQVTSSQEVQGGPVTSVVLDSLGRADTTVTSGTQPVMERLVGPAEAAWDPACDGTVAQRHSIQAGAPRRIECVDQLGRTVATVTDGFDGAGGASPQVVTAVQLNERGAKVVEYAPRLSTDTAEYPTTYGDFDALGRPHTKTVLRDASLFSTAAGQASVTTTYAYSGRTTTITVGSAPGGVGPLHMSRTVDARGKLIETTQDVTASGATSAHPILTRYLYDPAGAVTHIVDSAGNDLRASYDQLGRKLSVADPDRGLWSYQWDGLGRLRFQTDARNNVTTQEYDTVGRPIYRVVTSGANGATPLQTFWEWDLGSKKGVLGAVQDSNQYRREWRYDDLLRPYQMMTTIPAQDSVATGNRVFVVKLGYDRNFGRLKAKGFPSVPSAGGTSQSGETVVFAYTSKGFPLGETDQVTGKQYRRVKAMSALGRVTHQVLGNCLDETSQFDASAGQVVYLNSSRPTGLSSLPSDLEACPAASQPLRVEDYAYDQYLNLQRHRKNVPGLQSSESYAYDELQRLLSSTRTWAGPGVTLQAEAESYTYDDLGNITKKSNYGSLYAYGSSSRATGNAGPHAVVSVSKTDGTTAQFSYDANGNLVEGDGRHIDFDLLDRPVRVCSGTAATCDQAGAWATDFAYGPDGSRYLEKVLTPGDTKYAAKTVYSVDKDYELWVWAATGATPASTEERSYLGGSVVVYRRDGGAREVRYLTLDRLGSVEAVTKDDPAATALSLDGHGYDAFGKPRAAAWTTSEDRLHPTGDRGATTDRGFTGHEHLDAHYLIHMNGRVYDYRLGRFLSVDPIISDPANSQSINPYSYIGNNPLSGTDPTGYSAETEIAKAAVKVLVIIASNGVESASPKTNQAPATEVNSPSNLARAATVGVGAAYGIAQAVTPGGVLVPSPAPNSTDFETARAAALITVGVAQVIMAGADIAAAGAAEAASVSGTAGAGRVAVVAASGVVVTEAVATGAQGVVNVAAGALTAKNVMEMRSSGDGGGGSGGKEAAASRADSTAKGIPESRLGPSGKPKIHNVEHSTKKAAQEAAKQDGKGAPIKHSSTDDQPSHFHPTDSDGNKTPGVHHNYPD